MQTEILYGAIGSLITVLIIKIITLFHQKTIRDDISFLEYEKEHLAEMKRSSVAMNRSSFRAIFLVLFLIGLANVVHNLFKLAAFSETTSLFFSMALWMLVAAVSLKFFRRYEHLKNYKEYVKNSDIKLKKLNSKVKKS